MPVNRFFCTRPDYEDVAVTAAFGKGFKAGSGVNMSNPDNPIPAPVPVFRARTPALTTDPQETSPVGTYRFRYVYSWQLNEYSSTLYANFKAQFKFGSTADAYSYAVEKSNEYTMAIIVMEKSIAQDPVDSIIWEFVPVSEAEGTLEERLESFVRTYGSHYMVTVTAGFLAAFKAEVKGTSEEIRKELVGSVNALGDGWSAGGDASIKAVQRFKTLNAQLDGTVSAGELEKKDGDNWAEYDPALTSIDAVTDFIENINNQKIRFVPGVMAGTLYSYWATINREEAPMTREALKEWAGPAVPAAVFGVPRGTILAWYPQQDAINDGGMYKVPDGWAICNGSDGTPNLVDRFIRGSVNRPNQKSFGGEPTHVHEALWRAKEVVISAPQSVTDGVSTPERPHIKPAMHLPPYFDLIYIMKL